MNDKKIRMVALDLDGTTLNERGKLSPRTIEAFHTAMERGVHIVICTGRTFASLPQELFSIDGLEYIVTSNGAQITRLADMQTIYENNISASSIEHIVSILQQEDYSVEVFVKGNAYIAKEEYEMYLREGSSFRDVNYVISTRNPVDAFFDFMLDNKEEIENINISFPQVSDRSHLMDLLAPVKDVTLTTSFIHNLEIGGATTSKAEALRYLMENLQVTSKELMAVGDSHNDLAMIQLAEVGVVMGNASEEMQSFADYVTDDNANDGVAKVIEKFTK